MPRTTTSPPMVWIPKYRHKVFSEPYRETQKAIIEKIGFDYGIDVVELEVPEDHIHMVVRSEPKMSPSRNANEETIRIFVQNQLVELDKHEAKYRQWGLL